MKSAARTVRSIVFCFSVLAAAFCDATPAPPGAPNGRGSPGPAHSPPSPLAASPPAGAAVVRSAHRYFGYGALLLGAVAALSSSSEDMHCASARGAAVLGSAALATGLIKYRRVVDLGDGISRRDAHAILGGLAAAGMVAAVLIAGEGEDDGEGDDDVDLAHAGVGGGSLGSLVLSVAVINLSW